MISVPLLIGVGIGKQFFGLDEYLEERRENSKLQMEVAKAGEGDAPTRAPSEIKKELMMKIGGAIVAGVLVGVVGGALFTKSNRAAQSGAALATHEATQAVLAHLKRRGVRLEGGMRNVEGSFGDKEAVFTGQATAVRARNAQMDVRVNATATKTRVGDSWVCQKVRVLDGDGRPVHVK